MGLNAKNKPINLITTALIPQIVNKDLELGTDDKMDTLSESDSEDRIESVAAIRRSETMKQLSSPKKWIKDKTKTKDETQ